MSVVAGVLLWSTSLWLIQKVGQKVVNGRSSVSLASSVFYGWGVLLEDNPYDPPTNLSGQARLQLGPFPLSSCYTSRLFNILTY